MRKILGHFIKFIATIWDTLLFICIIALLLLRFAPIPFGYSPVVCTSNSMAPTFYENSLCYIDTKYDVNTIREGDIIAFTLSDGSMVTHRAHQLNEDGTITTKGDANDDVDISPITKEQILGENVLQLGYVGSLFRGENGLPNMMLIYAVIFAIALKLFLDVVSKSLLAEDNEEEENEKIIETAQALLREMESQKEQNAETVVTDTDSDVDVPNDTEQ